MLGNISTGERPLFKEEYTPRRPRRQRGDITVRVSFEAHRLAATYLGSAYAQVVPVRPRRTTVPPAAVHAPVDQCAERTGA